jgi:hypothetical protein
VNEEAQALAERLGEVIEEFSEANTITSYDALMALEYTYACVERYSDDATLPHKMH